MKTPTGKRFQSNFIFCILLAVLLTSCGDGSSEQTEVQNDFSVDYEKFKLDNGLEVVFHVDRSDPVVAVALTAHVGSAREKEGRTGFAHLFEHLLFLESENLGKGGLDKLSARIGGSGANGSTSRDRTNYFQTVPKDALEKMLWAEADKLGWFINTVTEPVLAKEKQVVKNEKRQSYDNRPYGHTSYVIDKNLYPVDHPYNWQVIGSLEDLQNATLSDVKEFFKRWYVPNNVTLVVSGDFEPAVAKEWVKKYFDEIPAGEPIETLKAEIPVLDSTKNLYHEDNFARLPELTMAWPTTELYHEDSYALDVLASYLSQGKKAPFNELLIDSLQLTSNVRMYNRGSELAGQFQVAVRAYPGKDLDEVKTALEDAFKQFENEGISEKDLDRIKASQETSFYRGLSSVLGKGFQLAQYNIFAGDPGFVEKDIQNILAVSSSDVMRVYEKYIKDHPFVMTSFVPKGEIRLAVDGAMMASVEEEEIIQGAEEEFDPNVLAEYEKTPSKIDRSVEPPYGEAPVLNIPAVWENKLSSGIDVFGIENKEVPLVQFNLQMKGGKLLEDLNKVGVSNLLAGMMMKGTAKRNTAELEEAIEQLGASIWINAREEYMEINGLSLKKNFEELMSLINEVLLQPRWDEEEFEILKASTLSDIAQMSANPNAIAQNEFNRLIYGEENIRSRNIMGDKESVESITLEDLKAYYDQYLSPSVATLHVVGDISSEQVIANLNEINSSWEVKDVSIPEYAQPSAPEKPMVYFYDVPGAKQSVLRIGAPTITAKNPDYYPAQVMNYILGGGGFASRLTQDLRETKGYTYGIRSGFSASENAGEFVISSGVRTNVTLEALQSIHQIMENYPQSFSEDDLATTKSFMIKSQARAFETASAKISMLENISALGWEADYVLKQQEQAKNMTLDKIRKLANQYANPNEMIWLVVGDAATQFGRLSELGFGKPILLNSEVKIE